MLLLLLWLLLRRSLRRLKELRETRAARRVALRRGRAPRLAAATALLVLFEIHLQQLLGQVAKLLAPQIDAQLGLDHLGEILDLLLLARVASAQRAAAQAHRVHQRLQVHHSRAASGASLSFFFCMYLCMVCCL